MHLTLFIVSLFYVITMLLRLSEILVRLNQAAKPNDVIVPASIARAPMRVDLELHLFRFPNLLNLLENRSWSVNHDLHKT